MRKNKNLFLSFLSLILMVSLLGACSNSEEDNSTAEGSDDPDEISGEIEVWGWNIAADSMKDAAENFMEEYPDTEINVKKISPDDLYDRMTVGMGSGGSGLPDVSLMESSELPGYLENFPDQFTNLSELGFDEHLPGFSDFKDGIVLNDEGDAYAMPFGLGPAAVFYRVDMFEEAGVNPDDIETWDDYINAGEKIKDKTGNKMLPFDTNDSATHQLMVNELGSSYFTEDDKVNLNSSESIEAMEVIKKMSDNDLMAEVSDGDSAIAAFANDNVATVPSGVWYSGTIEGQAPEQEGKWDVFKLPAFEEGGERAANLGGTELVIPSSTENPSLAYAFSEYFTTDADPQVHGLKEYGIFPSLIEAYDDPYFEEEIPFFNNSPIFELFAEVAEDIQPSVSKDGFSRAADIIKDAQTSIILQDEDVSSAMEDSAERLSNETSKEIEGQE